ncbi:hypothetical protein PR202_ga22529 [Eleusine coracana subsp. coracana]|uniref:BTB domain-containing protein n=1 Tax=Eleusine coracana subsp. coracana TaxID=191504 RepID=A0AAV5D2U8_ELECO|nr:hypothetical protein PR202_ga22529 [Eleusine coracana subsp. coracana]
MAEFFGPNNKETTTMAPVKVVDMEARVFKALLHFIYTDELPEIYDDDADKVKVLQGLVVAADRYEMERLKLHCDDVLRYHIDASTVVTSLQLADKHGCPRLKHASTKFLKDLLHGVAL